MSEERFPQDQLAGAEEGGIDQGDAGGPVEQVAAQAAVGLHLRGLVGQRFPAGAAGAHLAVEAEQGLLAFRGGEKGDGEPHHGAGRHGQQHHPGEDCGVASIHS